MITVFIISAVMSLTLVIGGFAVAAESGSAKSIIFALSMVLFSAGLIMRVAGDEVFAQSAKALARRTGMRVSGWGALFLMMAVVAAIISLFFMA